MHFPKTALALALFCTGVQATPQLSVDALSRTFFLTDSAQSDTMITRSFNGHSSVKSYPDNDKEKYQTQAVHLFGNLNINDYLNIESTAYLVGKIHTDIDHPDRADKQYILKNKDQSFAKITAALEVTPTPNSTLRYGYMPLDLELLESGDIKTAPITFLAGSLQYQTDLIKLDLTRATHSSSPTHQDYDNFGTTKNGGEIIRRAPVDIAQLSFSDGQLSGLASYGRQKGLRYYRLAQLEYKTRLSPELTVETGIQYRERKTIDFSGNEQENNHYAIRLGSSYKFLRTGFAYGHTNDKDDIEMSTDWQNQQGQACNSCGFYIAGYTDISLFHHAGESAYKWNIGADLNQWIPGLSVDGYLIYAYDMHSPWKQQVDVVDNRQREFGLKLSYALGESGAELTLQHSRNQMDLRREASPFPGAWGQQKTAQTLYQTRLVLNYPFRLL